MIGSDEGVQSFVNKTVIIKKVYYEQNKLQ